ncbi:MAG: diacylglycerol kinase family protein [Clostridia bacterium]|nr:diacylglycerol kinase family protein [Clostridia bacterium]
MATYVLFNSKANNGLCKQSVEKVQSLWGDKELIVQDMTQLDGYEAFFASIDGADVVICGGDGTLNRFINDTEGLTIENDIYYYPGGSGNDFWHDLAVGDDAEPQKINDYLQNLPQVTVKGKSYRFLNGVGYGIDGYCCEMGDKMREQSDKPINYTSIAIKGLLFHYKPTNAVITVDGKAYSFKKVWLAPTMNGRFYGGGMMPTPDQQRFGDDRKLSLLVMYGSGKIKTLAVFPSIFKGEHVKHTEMATVLTGRDIKVAFDRPVALQIDGETILDVSEYSARL